MTGESVTPFLEAIRKLVGKGVVIVSRHGFREIAADDISLDDVIGGVGAAEVVEDYPAFVKGPCVLVLQFDANGAPLHILWGTARGTDSPAVLITAYRPDPARWSDDFRSRRAT